jgi:Ca2+-binding EF-hand superfamily protein
MAFSLSVLNVAAQDYRNWDRNNDGVITRYEWRGTVQEFRDLDLNRDGVLSGNELRDQDSPWSNSAGQTFASLDRNGDGRINRGEWRGDRGSFVRADRNGDNFITRSEFMNMNAGNYDDDSADFTALDDNNDGRIERYEWNGTGAAFNRLDQNRDGVLSRRELALGDVAPTSGDDFDALDYNNNGVISRGEWRTTGSGSFNQYDVNGDGVITRREYSGSGAAGREETVIVDARQPWTDAGIYVNAGDVVSFRADGTITMMTGTEDRATPAGSVTGRTARNSPRPDQRAGTLLVRIGDSDIEAVGANGTFTARSSGRLYFGINDDHFPDNSGEYRVMASVRPR